MDQLKAPDAHGTVATIVLDGAMAVLQAFLKTSTATKAASYRFTAAMPQPVNFQGVYIVGCALGVSFIGLLGSLLAALALLAIVCLCCTIAVGLAGFLGMMGLATSLCLPLVAFAGLILGAVAVLVVVNVGVPAAVVTAVGVMVATVLAWLAALRVMISPVLAFMTCGLVW